MFERTSRLELANAAPTRVKMPVRLVPVLVEGVHIVGIEAEEVDHRSGVRAAGVGGVAGIAQELGRAGDRIAGGGIRKPGAGIDHVVPGERVAALGIVPFTPAVPP